MADFDWQKWVSGMTYRRTLFPTRTLLDKLGISQDYWDMAVFFSDLRNEHSAFYREISVDDALALGMKGVEAMFEYGKRKLDRDLLSQVIRDFYNGNKAALHIASRMDDIRGGDGDIYRKICEKTE